MSPSRSLPPVPAAPVRSTASDHAPAQVPAPAAAFALLLALGLSSAACTRDTPPPASADGPPVRTVVLAQPSSVAVERTIRAIGRLEAGEESDLGFISPGVIARIEVDIGDRVAAGQVLARLDTTALDAGAAQARDQLAQARRDLERMRGLIERRLVARQQYDDAQTRVEVAASALSAARYGQRYGRIVAAAPGVVLARLAEPGEVVAAGQPVLRVSAGGRDWRLPVEVADRDGAGIRVGDSAEVEIDAVPGQRFPARVARVGGQASARSGAIRVELQLEPEPSADLRADQDAETAARLRSGLVARARFALREGDTLQVPVSALLEADAGRGVLMVAEADRAGTLRARRREVRLDGLGTAEPGGPGGVRVSGGLPADARVIVAGAAFLQDGEPIRIAPSRARSAPAATAAGR